MGLSERKTDFNLEQKGNVMILRINGRLDAVSSPLVEKRVFEAVSEGSSNLVMDMSHVGYLSSAGMRMLLSTTKKLRAMSGKLAVCNVTTSVVDILKMSGFDHTLHIFKTEEEALKHF